MSDELNKEILEALNVESSDEGIQLLKDLYNEALKEAKDEEEAEKKNQEEERKQSEMIKELILGIDFDEPFSPTINSTSDVQSNMNTPIVQPFTCSEAKSPENNSQLPNRSSLLHASEPISDVNIIPQVDFDDLMEVLEADLQTDSFRPYFLEELMEEQCCTRKRNVSELSDSLINEKILESDEPINKKMKSNQIGKGDVQENQEEEEEEVESTNSNMKEVLEIIDPPETNHFVLEVKGSKSFRHKNSVREVTYRARLKHPQKNVLLLSLLVHLTALFETIIQEARRNYGQRALARIYIDHPHLEGPIVIPPTYLGELNPQEIEDYLETRLHSAAHIPADDALNISVAVVDLIEGKGRVPMLNPKKDVKRKRSCIGIVNSDNLCLPRAIVVGLARLQHLDNPNDDQLRRKFKSIRDKRCKRQKIAAETLQRDVGLEPNKVGMLEDIPKYEHFLKVSIAVISARIGNQKIYNGVSDYDRKIFLYHSQVDGEGHFDVITKVNGLMCTQYYCNSCHKGFKNATQHSCLDWCKVCGRGKCKYVKQYHCSECNRTCRSYDCLQAHKKVKKGRGVHKGKIFPSYCEAIFVCGDCGVTLNKKDRDPTLHECGEKMCKVCHQMHLNNDHTCYMRAMTASQTPDKFIFFDFECQQDEQTGEHVPNYVVASSICSQCEHEPVTETSVCNNCGDRCSMCKEYNEKEREFERDPCAECGKRQIIFEGLNTQNVFSEWLIDDQHRHVTAIAHNARGYDGYFIYNNCKERSIVPEPMIFSGSKIMYMHIGKGLNIRVIDSLNFLPMPLANLPKSFGLEELKKGFFPHLYNTPEHIHDKLPGLPDIHYYDPEGMTKSRRDEFLTWYEKNRNQPFDFQKEMKEYCISDVDILMKACWKFRQLLKKETGEEVEILDENDLMVKKVIQNAVDPFSYLTIASVCLGIFRSKFLPERWAVLLKKNAVPSCQHEFDCKCYWMNGRKENATASLEVQVGNEWVLASNLEVVKTKFVSSPIGLIPPHGYNGGDNHSSESLEWLLLLQEQWRQRGRPVMIQHARCPNGEKVVYLQGQNRPIRYKLDGYFELDGVKYACEYHGCNFHGCMLCFPRDREATKNGNISMAQRYRETMLKEKRLWDAGYIVITKWSCEFAREKQQKVVSDYIKYLNIQDPINIRDSYFGGRTNAVILHKKFTKGEKGHYVDFTSLYPDILKYKEFPVGHPVRIVRDFQNIYLTKCEGECAYTHCEKAHWKLPYFGIIKLKVLPPRNLYHPVLPIRCDGKLKFPLCYTCACEKDKVTACQCDDNGRAFTGTYCTPEIEAAINEGYEILEIYEVLHYPATEKYNPETKDGGLFTKYINTFLKLKQQASGYPEQIKREEEKDKYIENYLVNEGIQLEKDSIEKNPGLRSLSKLALNSFYGKFGQRTNLRRTKIVNTLTELYGILTDPSKVIADIHIMNEEVIMLEFSDHEDFTPLSLSTNVAIASFVTSWARLKLWKVLNRLGRRVLYFDTDSIIFSVKETDTYIPPLGEYLGQLTNELTCKEVGCRSKECDGHYIEEYVSCGPKNYSYKLNTGQVVCKVRGFSLNHRNSQVINFESMKDSLYAWKNKEELELVTVKTEVRRNKHEAVVYNRKVSKRYGVVYNKRLVLDDLTTIPFGYKV